MGKTSVLDRTIARLELEIAVRVQAIEALKAEAALLPKRATRARGKKKVTPAIAATDLTGGAYDNR